MIMDLQVIMKELVNVGKKTNLFFSLPKVLIFFKRGLPPYDAIECFFEEELFVPKQHKLKVTK